MKPAAFAYCRPDSIDEAVALLGELGGEASVLAGGMSLGPMLNMRLARPGAVIDLNRVAELARIEAADGEVRTGALVRQADALTDARLAGLVPLLALALPHVGHYQTRSRGTLGGSAAHADPSAEIPLCLVALGGSVELRRQGGTRRVPADAFFQGVLTTARDDRELVCALLWPTRRARTVYAFDEVAERRGDFAIAAAACAAELDAGGALAAVTLAFGGVEDRPRRAATGAFAGAPATPATARAIAASAVRDLQPLVDLRASAAFRRQLAEILARRVLARAFAAAGEA